MHGQPLPDALRGRHLKHVSHRNDLSVWLLRNVRRRQELLVDVLDSYVQRDHSNLCRMHHECKLPGEQAFLRSRSLHLCSVPEQQRLYNRVALLQSKHRQLHHLVRTKAIRSSVVGAWRFDNE